MAVTISWTISSHTSGISSSLKVGLTLTFRCFMATLVAQTIKNLPAMRETQVWSPSRHNPLEKGMVTHSSILAWRSPWTEEPSGLQSIGSQRVWHNWATNTFTFLSLEVLQRSVYLTGIRFTQSRAWEGNSCTRNLERVKEVGQSRRISSAKRFQLKSSISLNLWEDLEHEMYHRFVWHEVFLLSFGQKLEPNLTPEIECNLPGISGQGSTSYTVRNSLEKGSCGP